jgi:hypothetical protein
MTKLSDTQAIIPKRGDADVLPARVLNVLGQRVAIRLGLPHPAPASAPWRRSSPRSR